MNSRISEHGLPSFTAVLINKAEYERLLTQRQQARGVIEDLLKLVDTELTPNVRNMALQNYQLLNEAPINARRYLRDYP